MSVPIDENTVLALYEMIKNMQKEMKEMNQTIEREHAKRVEMLKNLLNEERKSNSELRSELATNYETIKSKDKEIIDLKKYINDETLRLYDKGDYSKVDIYKNLMDDEQKNFAIETTRKSLNINSDHSKCAKYIKEQFEKRFGGDWCVNLGTRNYGNIYFTYYDNCRINFQMGEFVVSIFKSSLGKETLRLHDKENYEKIHIYYTSMDDDHKNFAIDTTKRGLKIHDKSHFECAKYIVEKFQSEYGGNWCAILRARNYGGCYYTYIENHISFEIGEFCVNIFKSNVGGHVLQLKDFGDYDKYEINRYTMNNEKKNFIIKTTKECIQKYNDDHFECCKLIKQKLEKKYKGHWCVFLGIRNYGSANLSYVDNCYINFRMGEFYVTVFKSNTGNELLPLEDKGNYYKVDIINNEMNESQKDFAIETTRDGLKDNDSHFECAKYVREKLASRYGGIWCVIIRTRGYGASSFSYFNKCYIDFEMGEFFVSIFKSKPS